MEKTQSEEGNSRLREKACFLAVLPDKQSQKMSGRPGALLVQWDYRTGGRVHELDFRDSKGD